MEVAVAEPTADMSGVGVVRHEEWRRRGSGGLQHTRIEATHWSAPAHTYGKVVEGVSCVGADGRSIRARRQVEVLSARAPGLLQVLKATHTHSHSHSSSTSTTFNKNFDDLQLAINPLDVSSQKERLSIGRSGMLSARRPPSKVRPIAPPPDNGSTVSKLCHWFDADSQSQLQSPSIVANGTHKMNRLAEENSDKRSSSSENTDTNDTNNDYKNSEENLYDSCPEKESVFKDETEQLEEWRRASKVRRSLQYPCKAGRGGSKPLDLPDNWGSVSRIKRELENCQRNSLFSRSSKTGAFEDSTTTTTDSSLQTNTINEANENEIEADSFDDFLIKPSILKKKTFITVDTLNEVRGKLKSMTEQDNYLMSQTQQQHQDLDDGIVDSFSKTEDVGVSENKASPPNVKSYVFGMEAMLNSYNQTKPSYSCGTNSLESRVSKLVNGVSTRSDDWHARRKSYGFEKVQNQKNTNHLLSCHEKNMESSTDSGICRSTEIVNSLMNSKTDISKPNTNRGTVITLGNTDKKETFETWLMNNRKPLLGSYQKKNDYDLKKSTDAEAKLKSCSIQSSNQISISIPLREEDEETKKSLMNRDDIFKSNLMSESVSLTSRQSDDYSLKRHTIAVDAFKSNDFPSDMFEKKNKKVEFCKTEVHFTADSGKVNIVETDGKPPSTNNFRRRRRSSGVAPIRDSEKSNLPVTHFGDALIEKKENENQNGTVEEAKDSLKLNYAIITEIKSSSKQIENACDTLESMAHTNGNSEDVSENENIRGILKNKPIKPKPYHLGEDRTVLSEINQSHHQNSLERNLWGVKLKPVQDKVEAPLWCSSVSLKNDVYKESEDGAKDSIVEQTEKPSLYGKIERIQKDDAYTNGQLGYKSQSEHKGYSTKINFGNGDAIVETSYNHQKNGLNTSKSLGFSNVSNQMVKIEPQEPSNVKQSIVVSKYLNSTSNSFKSNKINDDLKAVQKIKNVMGLDRSPDAKNESSEERESLGSTFADHITTPRSLMPTRGSARKLKEHELSYFGVKVTSEKKSEPPKAMQKEQRVDIQRAKANSVMQVKQFQEARFVKTSPEKTTKSVPHKKGDFYESHPIYENVSATAKKTSSDVTTKSINSGESIIDELTKAADEILQALHDYSDEDVGKMGYLSDKHSQPLSTISETNTWNDRTKTSEHKAVQTVLAGTRRYNTLSTTKTNGKVRTSSNSSLESITKEVKAPKKKTPIVVEPVEKPERPQRRKISSGDAVKARRLQRASSRDALLQVQGSSSEDISGHMEVVRKKTVRRSKYGGETTKRSDSKILADSHSIARSLERKKESSKSSKYVSSTVPEIRHKTAVSTIMSLTDRHSSKPKPSERSRHKERIREGTVSSIARDKLTIKEKSRSADTSLDRENGQKERTHKRDKSREKHKDDKLKRITEELGSDVEKKNKLIFDKRSPGSSSVNTSSRTQRGSQPGRSSDRQATSGRVTNTRTEYDKSLRLI